LAILAGTVSALALPSAAQAAEPCPNEQLRAQSNSTQLPDCRAYELVTPVDKLGLSVDVPTGGSGAGAAVSSDGQRVLYFPIFALLRGQSEGLDGASEATRTSGGWLSTSVAFPTGQEHPNFDYQIETLPVGGTPDLSTLFYDTYVFVGDAAKPVSSRVYARNPDGSFAGVSQNDTGEAVSVGTSADGSHAVFEMTPVRTEEKGGGQKGGILSLYDRVGGETVPVGVGANGSPTSTCGAILGGTDEVQVDSFGPLHDVAKFRDAVSSDGSRIFFESPDPRGHLFSSDPGCGQPGEVYVRENAATTTEISRSQKTGSVGAPAPDGATFQAASADGSRVFFHSPDQLTNDPAATSGGLYEYDLESGVLTFIAVGEVYGSGLSVSFAPLLSSDGTHLYFLGFVPGKGPAPGPAGNKNLYLWDEGRISFISPEPVNPPSATVDARVSADGSTLAFTSISNLTGYDSHGVGELYVYKANGGSLACISCDPNGAPPAGPALFFGTVYSTPIASQDVTSDGSRVFFQSPDPLLPGATNGLYNVYEYENGALYLLSDGNGPYASRLVGASGDGTDVIIATYDSLVPQDQDNGNGDLYDVRVGGGFPYLPPAGGCSGDSCQGQPALAPVLSSASSASYPAGENLAPPVAAPVVKPLTRAQKFAKALRACRAKHNKRKRAVCETQARKNYAPPHKAKKTGRKGK
jgi:hypothetical protein